MGQILDARNILLASQMHAISLSQDDMITHLRFLQKVSGKMRTIPHIRGLVPEFRILSTQTKKVRGKVLQACRTR